MSFKVEVDGGKSVRLTTAGKYCDRDIVVTGKAPVIQALEITENGVYTAPTGTDGYSPVSVNVPVPDGYVKPAGTLEIAENGEYDVAAYQSVAVQVANEGGSGENQLHGTLDGTLAYIDSPVSKVIGYACRGITTLKTVSIPNATSIGTYAFYGCTGITSVTAPNATSLGTYAFYQCSELTEINFPKAASAPSTCFYQCSKLKKADFGAAKSLAGNAFAYCSKLGTLILRYDGVVTLTSTTFSGASFDGYVYVPTAQLDNYSADSSWSSNAPNAKFRAIEDYPEICG